MGRWGVTVIGIAVDHAQAVSNYARELKIPYPLLVGEQDALDAALKLGISSPVFPFTVFTDAAGQIVALYVGELHPGQADFILSRVRSLDLHELTLNEARRSIGAGLSRLPEVGEGPVSGRVPPPDHPILPIGRSLTRPAKFARERCHIHSISG